MFRSLFSGGRAGKRHQTAGLRVEPLPDRLVPAAFAYDGATDTLTVGGTTGGRTRSSSSTTGTAPSPSPTRRA